ncbi:diaminopimelate decarboxylase family protein [Capilliphycus salinus ALCB114379]|uniref:diaminopimelate decarboxylase family protein n=1 Tax=Capilliphycus salinus TaxID=2768948 RepID=UPI0039A54D42
MTITSASDSISLVPSPLPFSAELAEELLTIYGSPLYVYQAEQLQETINTITRSISYPKTRFQFASVTNGNISLLQIFHRSGWGLHANTPGDVYLGLKAGFLPEQIVYSGSNLNELEWRQLFNWGVRTFNLDSVAQLQLLGEVFKTLKPDFIPQIGFRLNYPEITGESRIGVRPSEFSDALKIAQSFGLKIGGIHFYRGTGTNATRAFTEVISSILAVGQQLPDWSYLDFGGGFGYPYRRGNIAFNWQEFGREIHQALRPLAEQIELIIEPGRAACAQSGTILAKVVSVKWQESKQIVGVDTTVANLSVPSVHGGYREIIAFSSNSKLYQTDVCGNTTYSRDYLGRNCSLPALKPGDILAILDCGAYGYAMSSHFLHRPRPAEVLVVAGKHRLIRRRENYDILMANQVF